MRLEDKKEDFDVLGAHLSNASRKYEESHKRLDKFSDKLTTIEEYKEIKSGF